MVLAETMASEALAPGPFEVDGGGVEEHQVDTAEEIQIAIEEVLLDEVLGATGDVLQLAALVEFLLNTERFAAASDYFDDELIATAAKLKAGMPAGATLAVQVPKPLIQGPRGALRNPDPSQLEAFARTHLGLDRLEAWDVPWASEKLRQHAYAFSDEEVKQYFPQDAVLGGLFGLGASLVFFFTGNDVVEYATLGIGGGFWLLAATVAILVAHRIGSTNG